MTYDHEVTAYFFKLHSFSPLEIIREHMLVFTSN